MSKTTESKNRVIKEQIVEDIKAKLDGAQSVVFDEAENRLHAQKAVLALLMGAR